MEPPHGAVASTSGNGAFAGVDASPHRAHPAPMTGAPGVVVFRRTGGVDDIDSIDAYSRRLVDALRAAAVPADYECRGLAPVVDMDPAPPWVLLQYNPFRFGRSGFAPRVVRDIARLRRHSHTPLAVMVHESWIEMSDPKSTLIGLWQRAQLRALLRHADAVMTSTQALAREIGTRAVHVPVPANITPIPTSSVAAREQLGLEGAVVVTLFGQAHPSRALGHAEAAIAALAEAHGADRLVILNLGAGAPPLRVPPGVSVHSPGRQTADELSLGLWASDLVLVPFVDGVSTRRSTMMAALAHGRPVLGCRGHSTDSLLAETDAIVLTRVGDRAAFARAAVELTSDPERLEALGAAGRRLYETRFDWAVTARRVGGVLQTITTKRRRVTFLAHDVGGSGGMERHSEELLRRLLDAGRPVTVIARTCTIGESEHLRFIRVRTPRRPGALGYPAFFAVASLLVARQKHALVHTTGAIVANRADVSTIHYCHRAATTRVVGSRASRGGRLYELNYTVHRLLSLAGEAWCYRPRTTRLLCAVSSGVASELGVHFPATAGAVRVIPNGVDSSVFRPDPTARSRIRAELGLGQPAELALFVGGDWERKGLVHAVDALAFAPGWHLAVAGAGDPAPYIARARAAGTEPRLRFLGPVRDMPSLYAAGDAFVMPTAYEAFPLVALEAAASGLPLLITRVNGAEDLIHDGDNGWFVDRNGRDIASRLNELQNNPELARKMSASARAAAAHFTWDSMASGYLSLYARLEANPSRAASVSA